MKLGDRLTLVLSVLKGKAITANIEHTNVSLSPDGTAVYDFVPPALGNKVSKGVITNAEGKVTSCEAPYTVVKRDDPIEPLPTCTLTPDKTELFLGETVTLRMVTGGGRITSATIDGRAVPLTGGFIMQTPGEAKTFTSEGKVIGPGGSNSCKASYTVKNGGLTAPTCTMSVNPPSVALRGTIEFTIAPMGNYISATINNRPVYAATAWRLSENPSVKGTGFKAFGFVSGPGGSNTCEVEYDVTDVGPTQSDPSLIIVPTYCGNNVIPQSSEIKEICFATYKRDLSLPTTNFAEAIIVNYADGYQEVMPIVNRKQIPKGSPGQVATQEVITSYINRTKPNNLNPSFLELDVRTHNLTKMPGSSGEVPDSFTGWTSGLYPPTSGTPSSKMIQVDKFRAK